MSELEEKLTSLMSDPQLMQQIAAMAQSLSQPGPEPQRQGESSHSASGPDPQLMQVLAQTMGHSGVDQNQQALLQALSPYLSSARIFKLERAMRAAKMAGAASLFLNANGLQLLTGR